MTLNSEALHALKTLSYPELRTRIGNATLEQLSQFSQLLIEIEDPGLTQCFLDRLAHELNSDNGHLITVELIQFMADQSALTIYHTTQYLNELNHTQLNHCFCAAIEQFLPSLDLNELLKFSGLDRFWRRTQPEKWDAFISKTEQAVLSKFSDTNPQDNLQRLQQSLQQWQFLCLRGKALEQLIEHSPHALPILQLYAQTALQHLARAPRSISQAKAERLLAVQVYTDPYHFIRELLQNADDASATQWTLKILDDEVHILHNGITFDIRDVVGLLSIGQTSKSQNQIGFFGVGFKSVYQICDRPQIHTGLFHFEISDVSRPRPIQLKQSDLAEDGLLRQTLLVLPLKKDKLSDAFRAGLFEQIRGLPAPGLLTLKHLQQLTGLYQQQSQRLTLETKDSGAHNTNHNAIISRTSNPDDEESREHEYYIYRWHEHDSADSAQNQRKTGASLVALQANQDWLPRPIDQDAPQIYSFLPTDERQGLKFVVHAPFELPVDRERLNFATETNQSLLRSLAKCLSGLFIEAIQGTAAAMGGEDLAEYLDRLLSLLPIAGTDDRPHITQLSQSCVAALKSTPCYLNCDYQLVTANELWLNNHPKLQIFLAQIPLGSRRLAVFRESQPRQALLTLGAKQLSQQHSLELLKHDLESQDSIPDTWQFLTNPEFWRLFDASLLTRFHAAKIWPNARQQPQALADLYYVSLSDRALYQDHFPLIHEALNDDLQLCQRLGVHKLAPTDLKSLLVKLDSPADYIQEHGSLRVLKLFTSLERSDLIELAKLPIFANTSDQFAELERRRLWINHPLKAFVEQYQNSWPELIAEDLESSLHAELFFWGATKLSTSELLTGLASVTKDCEPETRTQRLIQFHHLAEQSSFLDSLSTADLKLLRDAAIFPTQTHTLCQLSDSENTALLPDLAVFRDRLPDWNWVHPALAIDYLRKFGIKTVTIDDLILTFINNLDAYSQQQQANTLQLFVDHANAISPRMRQQVLDAPIWPGAEDGTDKSSRRAFADLARPASNVLVGEYFTAFSTQAIASRQPEHKPYFQLAEKLGAKLKSLTFDDALKHFCDADQLPKLNDQHRDLIRDLISQNETRISKAQAEKIFSKAIFHDQNGQPGSLAGADKLVFCEKDKYQYIDVLKIPRLHQSEQHFWRDLFRIATPTLASWDAIFLTLDRAIESIQNPLDQAEEIADLRHKIAKTRDFQAIFEALNYETRQKIQNWPLWHTQDLKFAPGRHFFAPKAVSKALQQACPEVLVLADDVLADAEALSNVFQFVQLESVLLQLWSRSIEEGQNLATVVGLDHDAPDVKPQFLSFLEHLLRTVEPQQLTDLPLHLTTQQTLTRKPLYLCDPADEWLFEQTSLRLADRDWAALLRRLSGILKSNENKASRLKQGHLSLLFQKLRTAKYEPESPGQRQRFYQWLLDQQQRLKSDPGAQAELSRLPFLLTQADTLEAPRNLALGLDIPGMNPAQRCHSEVPEELVNLLNRAMDRDDDLVQRALKLLIQAQQSIEKEKDFHAAANVANHIAQLLKLDEVPLSQAHEIIRKHKLHRHFRLAAHDDKFHKPARITVFSKHSWLNSWLEEQQALQLHSAYGELGGEPALCFARSLGARSDFDAELLLTGVDSSLDDTDSQQQTIDQHIQRARFISRACEFVPDLIPELAKRAWVPNRNGTLCRPDQLFLSTTELEATLLSAASLFVDQAFEFSIPNLDKWDFRTTPQPRDIVKALAQSESPEDGVQDLLLEVEKSLSGNNLDAAFVQSQLSNAPVLQDAQHRPLKPSEATRFEIPMSLASVARFWPAHKQFPRFAAALQIPQAINAAFIESLYQIIEKTPKKQLLQHFDALASLPAQANKSKCKPSADRLVAAIDQDNQPVIVPVSYPQLASPEPDSFLNQIINSDLAYCFPKARQDGLRYLKKCGLKTLGASFIQGSVIRAGLQHSGPREDKLNQNLVKIKQQLRSDSAFPEVFVSSWPETIQIVSDLVCSGRMLSQSTELQCPAGLAHDGQCLMVTESEALDMEFSVNLLCRSFQAKGQQENWKADLADAFREDGTFKSTKSLKLQATPASDQSEANTGDKPHRWWNRLKNWWSASPREVLEPTKKARPETLAKRKAQAERQAEAERQKNSRRQKQPQRANARKTWSHDESNHSRPWTPPKAQPRYFQSSSRIGPQLSHVSEPPATSHYGFQFSPETLPNPYIYAPREFASEFARRSQTWINNAVEPEFVFPSTGLSASGLVSMSGRLPKGRSCLPKPLLAKLTKIQTSVEYRHSQQFGLDFIELKNEAEVQLQWRLFQAPALDSQATSRAPEHWTRSSVPDSELPAELLLNVDIARKIPDVHQRCLYLQNFIRQRYRYDPSYLEDDLLGQWLERQTRGTANQHLAALHLLATDDKLGAGVCYELNILLCETLRRAGIPAILASGWVLDNGTLAAPDHLWAMALIPTAKGPLLTAFDAATTTSGRPLRRQSPEPVNLKQPADVGQVPMPTVWPEADNVKHQVNPSQLAVHSALKTLFNDQSNETDLNLAELALNLIENDQLKRSFKDWLISAYREHKDPDQ